MPSAYEAGTRVKWKWGSGYGEGRIAECFTDDVSRTINGTEVTRHASNDEPAYLIRQDDGGRVLKSHSEVSAVS